MTLQYTLSIASCISPAGKELSLVDFIRLWRLYSVIGRQRQSFDPSAEYST
jgi:hypothetical protein